MSETDAKQFIQQEVRTLLKKYALLSLAIIGIPNLLAVGALFLSVNSAARTIARVQAEERVSKILSENQKRFDELAGLMVERTKEVARQNDALLVKVGEQRSGVAAVSAEAEKLKEAVLILRTNAGDLENIAQVVNVIRSSPIATNLLLQYSSLQTRTSQLETNRDQLNARAYDVDDALDKLGQAGYGGVWPILFGKKVGADDTPQNNAYYQWMNSIHTGAVTRMDVSRPLTNRAAK
jgi:hypothetical protein